MILLDKINKSGFSRVPIFKETVDNIEGILYINTFLKEMAEEEVRHKLILENQYNELLK